MKEFLETAVQVLGEGDENISKTISWCSWTTFTRLANDAGYWQAGLPRRIDFGEKNVVDGGVWMQPFLYSDIAHVIIPATFCDSLGISKSQDIQMLSRALTKLNIPHAVGIYALEFKRF